MSGKRGSCPSSMRVTSHPKSWRRFLVAANRTTELGGWDAELLCHISKSQAGAAGTGFSLADVDELIASLGRARTARHHPDDIPAKQPARTVHMRAGDLYRLGEHRLLRRHDRSFTAGKQVRGKALARLRGLEPPVAAT